MDTKVIEIRQPEYIVLDLDGTSAEFIFTLDKIHFIPDEVIVKNINYCANAPETKITLIHTNLVSDIIGSFFSNVSSSPNLHFFLNRPISNRDWKVTLQNINGNLDTTRNGQLSVHFEFVKYKEVKAQKIN